MKHVKKKDTVQKMYKCTRVLNVKKLPEDMAYFRVKISNEQLTKTSKNARNVTAKRYGTKLNFAKSKLAEVPSEKNYPLLFNLHQARVRKSKFTTGIAGLCQPRVHIDVG